MTLLSRPPSPAGQLPLAVGRCSRRRRSRQLQNPSRHPAFRTRLGRRKPCNSSIKPDQLGEFAQFVRATVERYDGDGINDAPGSPVVTYWNCTTSLTPAYVLGDDWHKGWRVRATEYAEMLSVAYEAIKQANPKAQVLSAASPTTSSSIRAATSSRSSSTTCSGTAAATGRHHEHPFLSGQLLDRRDESRLPKTTLVSPWRGGKSRLRSTKTDPRIRADQTYHDHRVRLAQRQSPDQPSSPEIQARASCSNLTQSVAAYALSTIIFSLTDPDGYPYERPVSASTPPQPAGLHRLPGRRRLAGACSLRSPPARRRIEGQGDGRLRIPPTRRQHLLRRSGLTRT